MLLDLGPLRRHREFRRLFAGQTVSLFGTMLTWVALPWQVWDVTRSSAAVGMLGVAQLLPMLVFGLLGGTTADAFDRRRLVIGSEIVLAAGSLALFWNARLERPSVVLLFVLAALLSIVDSFHRPALEAFTQRLLTPQDMVAVGALNAMRFGLAAVVGPALAGLVLARGGAAWAYAIDAATFAASVAFLAGLGPAPPAAGARAGLAELRGGLAYALASPVLLGTYVVDLVAMTFAFPMALFPSLAERWGGATAVGWLYAGMSLGTIATTATSGWTGRVTRHGAAVVVSAALWGVAITALAFASSLPVALLCLAAAGAADTVSGIFRTAIWNETIPNEMRGRLSSVEMISYKAGPLLGNTRAGWMAAWRSNAFSIGVGGAVCVAGVLALVPLLPAFWRYESKVAKERVAAG